MTFVDNIVFWYLRATDSEHEDGMTWYARAHDIAREAGDVSLGAGIISALSPRMPWNRNVALARMAFVQPLTGGALTRSIESVNRIRNGEAPLDVLGGLKTRAFYANILDPENDEAVTVDTHAIKIAGINRDSVGKGLYNEIANGYRDAANLAGILPHQMQAITWVAYRRAQALGWADIILSQTWLVGEVVAS